MNEEAKAVGDWFASEEGERCSDPTTLGADKGQDRYLRNRLWKAFSAGIDAGKRIARNQTEKQT
jgi:hypothetical protein